MPTATMQAGGASLEWIMDVLTPAEGGRYERLLGAAKEVQASADGLYFLPHLLGERSPYWNPRVRAVFAGLGRHHGPEHLSRAVIEGVAFNLFTGMLAFQENGAEIDGVDAVGGAANSDLLLQVFADVWGVPLYRRNLVDEATALGAAIVGGVGVGMFESFQVAKALSSTTSTFKTDLAAHHRYGRAHEIFLDAYQRLESWFGG